MKKTAITLLILLCLCVGATSAQAYYVEVSPDSNAAKSVFYLSTFHWDADGDGDYDEDPFTGSGFTYNQAYAGIFDLSYKASAASPVLYTTYGFCVDLELDSGSGVATLKDITTENYKQAAWILENYYSAANTDKLNAAIQLAIWDAVYGSVTNGGVTSDAFLAWYSSLNGVGSTDVITEYNAIIAALAANYTSGFDASEYQILDFADGQDMIVPNPVPVPSAFALLSFGLLGISAVYRRRK